MTIAAVIREKGRNVVSVAPDAGIAEIAAIIASRRIGAVMVLADHGGLAGIVSERDVVKALAKHGTKVLELTASDLMTRNVTTVDHADLRSTMRWRSWTPATSATCR